MAPPRGGVQTGEVAVRLALAWAFVSTSASTWGERSWRAAGVTHRPRVMSRASRTGATVPGRTGSGRCADLAVTAADHWAEPRRRHQGARPRSRHHKRFCDLPFGVQPPLTESKNPGPRGFRTAGRDTVPYVIATPSIASSLNPRQEGAFFSLSRNDRPRGREPDAGRHNRPPAGPACAERRIPAVSYYRCRLAWEESGQGRLSGPRRLVSLYDKVGRSPSLEMQLPA